MNNIEAKFSTENKNISNMLKNIELMCFIPKTSEDDRKVNKRILDKYEQKPSLSKVAGRSNEYKNSN